MATPPLRRSWPVALPAVQWAGLLGLAALAGFIMVSALPGALGQLAFDPSELTLRPWTALSYPFVHTGLLPLSLDLAALLLLAPGLERGVGGARLLGWFTVGTLAGAALALLLQSGPLVGSGPALVGMAVGLAWRGPEQVALSPLGLKGRWLGTALAVAALLPPVTPSLDGPVRVALIGALVAAALGMGRTKPPMVERRVELPNSHFSPPGVHHEVTMKTPWDVIDLDALHEVNRGGVEALLVRARELGPTYLSAADRELLDRMATAARLAAERSRSG
ncbi:MAG: rhomboid family intramembrane serine protease [Gemmatimonadales bacterium]